MAFATREPSSYLTTIMSDEAGQAGTKMLLKEEVYAIQGAVFEVYREMGSGFLESVYQECLERELESRGIPYIAQPDICLSYKGAILQHACRPDLVCHGKVILEIKAVREIAPEHRAQVLNYLRATGHRLGLIVNFGHHPKVEIERFVR